MEVRLDGRSAVITGGSVTYRGRRAGVESVDVLRLPRSGYVHGIAGINANILECRVLLAVNEVDRRRHVQFLDVHAGRGVPDADQFLRMRIG